MYVYVCECSPSECSEADLSSVEAMVVGAGGVCVRELGGMESLVVMEGRVQGGEGCREEGRKEDPLVTGEQPANTITILTSVLCIHCNVHSTRLAG